MLAQVQEAILTGHCLEFDYLADGAGEPSWRRVAVYGLVHGPVTYLIGRCRRTTSRLSRSAWTA